MTNEQELTHIDLFSGIGGFTLAGEWAGFKTIVFCEKEEFCQKILQARFGGIVADSKCRRLKKNCRQSYNNGTFQQGKKAQGKKSKIGGATSTISIGTKNGIPIIPKIRDFDGTKWRGATLLTGGFPCQPFSVAGQRRGKEDDRYLWPEMLRVINEAKPRWILAENVPGIFRMALDTVLADLEGEGYTVGTFIIPACSLNAPHRRNRIWIVAHDGLSQSMELSGSEQECRNRIGNSDQDTPDSPGKRKESISQQRQGNGIKPADSHAPDSSCKGLQGDARREFRGLSGTIKTSKRSKLGRANTENKQWEEDWYEVAARFCRVDDGIPDRIHRLKALGNAIVPQIAFEILKNIAWIEKHYD